MSETPKIESRRKRYEILRGSLENERSSFISHWRDIADYVLPRRPQFNVTDTNKGERRNQKIIDATAGLAARTLRSGMMGGVTSPARPWFRLTTSDPALAEYGPVKEWLHITSQRMTTVFLRSNLYNALPTVYGDIGTFATGALFVEEDFDDVVRFYPFPIGSYMIAANDRLKVDVFFREFRLTVRQLVQKFGKRNASGNVDWSNISTHVKNMYDNGSLDTWIDICHVIQPNDEYNPKSLLSKHKKYRSCYYEKGSNSANSSSYISSGDEDRYLSDKGYDYFPVLCPRWETTGEDVYGTDCPGMTVLGYVKALQTMQKRKAQAIEKMVNPPMVGPSMLKNQRPSILPGDMNYLDEREGQKGFRPVHEVNPRINELVLDIQDHREFIRRTYYEDLFLMLASSDRREITAREIDERKEEKLLVLGPVLEQLNQDLLDPLIDITFDIMARQGLIPEPPEELQGSQLKVEYISVMAQAQKLVGIAGVERFAAFVGDVVAQTQNPEVLDKIDVDQMIDIYGDLTSVPPGIVRPDEAVAEIRQGRAQAQQAQQQMMAMTEGAKAAKDLSGADMSGDNALTALLRQAQAGQVA